MIRGPPRIAVDRLHGQLSGNAGLKPPTRLACRRQLLLLPDPGSAGGIQRARSCTGNQCPDRDALGEVPRRPFREGGVLDGLQPGVDASGDLRLGGDDLLVAEVSHLELLRLSI